MFHRIAPVIVAAFLAVAAAACSDDSQDRMNPAGPGTMNGAVAGGANGGMPGGGMPGGGMPGGGMPGGGMPGGGMPGGGMSMRIVSEFDYLAQMIPHHEEAVMTARILQTGTARREMREFAAAIIATQSAEIAQMQAWLATWYPGRDTRVTYRPMMRDLGGLTGDSLDRAFLTDMVPHHMMAVMMSEQLLVRQLAVHAEVTPFATAIRDTQRAEILTMQLWLHDWFGLAP